MTATIDSTWGGSEANAYDSVTNVNAFIHDNIYDHTDWDGLSLEKKTAAILEATRDLDSVQFIGARYYRDQELEMPREVSLDFPNNRVGSATTTWSEVHARMERDVKQALAYQALHIARLGGRNFHAENQSQGIKSYSEAVGPIRESYTYGNSGTKRLSPEAQAKLAPWVESKRVYRG